MTQVTSALKRPQFTRSKYPVCSLKQGSYLEDGLLVRDKTKLAKNYTRTWGFQADLLSLLPTDLFYLVVGLNQPIIRVNRLIRFHRFSTFSERTERQTNYPNLFRIGHLFIIILIIIHLNGCVYFQASHWLGFGVDPWVYPALNSSAQTASLLHMYIYSFYWSTLTLTTIGEVPRPEQDIEYLFVVADFLIGVLIFATIVGNVGSIITNMNASKSDFQSRMDSVKKYMELRNVGSQLQERVIKWFDYLWTNEQSLDEEVILSMLPDKLKAEIAINVHMETLRKVALFQDCESGFLAELVLKLKLTVFSPGDYVCRKDDVGREMYIVKSGNLNVVADDGRTVFATLCKGSVFGEVSILNIKGNKHGNRRTASIRSVGYSDLFCLSKDDLWVALQEYPEAQESLLSRGEQLLRRSNQYDEELAKKQKNIPNLPNRVSDLELGFGDIHKVLARHLSEFGSIQRKLKRRLHRLETTIAKIDSPLVSPRRMIDIPKVGNTSNAADNKCPEKNDMNSGVFVKSSVESYHTNNDNAQKVNTVNSSTENSQEWINNEKTNLSMPSNVFLKRLNVNSRSENVPTEQRTSKKQMPKLSVLPKINVPDAKDDDDDTNSA